MASLAVLVAASSASATGAAPARTAAPAATASPAVTNAWVNGPTDDVYESVPSCSGSVQEGGASAGWYGDPGVDPTVGQIYYLRIVWSADAGISGCGLSPQNSASLSLPPDTRVAVTSQTPVLCYLEGIGQTHFSQDTVDCPSQPTSLGGNTYTIPDTTSSNGRWSTPGGTSWWLAIPVVTTAPIDATATGQSTFVDGIADPTATSSTTVEVAPAPVHSVTLEPGAATDISVGADGATWVTGTNPVHGGYGIWAWNGSAWIPAPGGAVAIAVQPGGYPWVVNSQHAIFRWDGSGWSAQPGAATDISVGADGAVWVTGTNVVHGGYGLYRWTGSAWAPEPGGAVGVSVDPAGDPWVVNSQHAIFHWNGSGWSAYPGGATAISVGADDVVWIVGTNAVDGGYGLYEWNGSAWAPTPGGAVTLATDQNGYPWLVNSAHRIYHLS